MYNIEEVLNKGVKLLTQTFWGPFVAVMFAGAGAQANCPPVSMGAAILTGVAVSQLDKRSTTSTSTTEETNKEQTQIKQTANSEAIWWKETNQKAKDEESHLNALQTLLIETGSKWEPESLVIGESKIIDCVFDEDLKLFIQIDKPTTDHAVKTWMKNRNHLGGKFSLDKAERKVCSTTATVLATNRYVVVIEGIGLE